MHLMTQSSFLYPVVLMMEGQSIPAKAQERQEDSRVQPCASTPGLRRAGPVHTDAEPTFTAVGRVCRLPCLLRFSLRVILCGLAFCLRVIALRLQGLMLRLQGLMLSLQGLALLVDCV